MKTLLLALFAVVSLAGQAAIAQAPPPAPKASIAHQNSDDRPAAVIVQASR